MIHKAIRRGGTALTLVALLCLPAFGANNQPLAFQGTETEEFLRNAEVVDIDDLKVGITNPQVITLSDGQRTAKAVWKSIDQKEPIMRFADGSVETKFSDSYKNELAAYELDKIMGYEMVPATVYRRVRGESGSLQLWIENCMTEKERRDKKIAPKGGLKWNKQALDIRLWQQLVRNSDFRNIRNILVDEKFKLYIIDNSRSFSHKGKLNSPKVLKKFSRRTMEKIKTLEFDALKAGLSEWLNDQQIESILKRRDEIVELAAKLVEKEGENKVMVP